MSISLKRLSEKGGSPLTRWQGAAAAMVLCLWAGAVQAQAALTPRELEAQRRAQAEAQTRKERDAREAAEAENRRLRQELERARAARPAVPPPAAVAQPRHAEAQPAAAATRFRHLEAVLQVTGCAACGEMSVIEAGTFDMGSPTTEPQRDSDEGPVRAVRVGKFEIGRTEVTQWQWKAVMGSNPSLFKACGDACPVDSVSWDDITGRNGFLARLNKLTGLNYRLPSEAEWEYAARAGTKTAYWWGDTINPGQANYDGNDSYAGGASQGPYQGKPVKADEFEANAWGLYNVHGNVWEWVQDCWHGDYQGAPATGKALEEGCSDGWRVLRGSSWFFSARYLRAAARFAGPPDHRHASTGFRIARTL